MKTGWIIGIVTAWVLLAIFGLICDQAWFDGSTLGTLTTLMHPHFPASNIPIVGLVVGAITVLWDWIQALFVIIFLKFDFFSGPYMLIWYILCLPAGIGVIVSIVITVMRGVPSQ
jgi:hypothetical protein